MQYKLPRTRLHDLLDGHMVWSDLLWTQALSYLTKELSVDAARDVAGVGSRVASSKLDKTHREVLGEFRHVPPTVLVGFYDLYRENQAAHARIVELSRRYPRQRPTVTSSVVSPAISRPDRNTAA